MVDAGTLNSWIDATTYMVYISLEGSYAKGLGVSSALSPSNYTVWMIRLLIDWKTNLND